MPFERTAATAGNHIDRMTTAPEPIRLTLSSKLFRKARNWPAAFVSIKKEMILSIPGRVMLPFGAPGSPIVPALPVDFQHGEPRRCTEKGDIALRAKRLELSDAAMRQSGRRLENLRGPPWFFVRFVLKTRWKIRPKPILASVAAYPDHPATSLRCHDIGPVPARGGTKIEIMTEFRSKTRQLPCPAHHPDVPAVKLICDTY
jgi:hypothetical protein